MPDHIYKFSNISIDFNKHEILKDDTKIDLTLKEFEKQEL